MGAGGGSPDYLAVCNLQTQGTTSPSINSRELTMGIGYPHDGEDNGE